MEMLKVTFTSKFVDDSGLSIQYLYGKVAEVETDPRRYYAKDSTNEFDDEKFTQIMFLDGCFILQFISCFLHKPEDLKMPGRGEAGGGESKMDRLLQNFCKHVRAKPALGRRESFRQKILKLYGKLSKALTGNFSKGLDEQTQHTHLLEFFHTLYVHSGVSDDHHPSGEKMPSYWHYPAKEFRNVGISLKPSKTSRFSDVRSKELPLLC
ncbi:UPF0481 protein [Salix suchowensis]|nr:UPF0481 protein [Salix suchowensis]